jgi:hypothetical protein
MPRLFLEIRPASNVESPRGCITRIRKFAFIPEPRQLGTPLDLLHHSSPDMLDEVELQQRDGQRQQGGYLPVHVATGCLVATTRQSEAYPRFWYQRFD